MLIAMAAVVVAIQMLAGPVSLIKGRLPHHLPDNMPADREVAFEQERLADTRGPDVRREAVAILSRASPATDPGWLEDPAQDALFASFDADPEGTLVVERESKLPGADQARVEALLLALAASDADIRATASEARGADEVRRRGRRAETDAQAREVVELLQGLRALRNERSLGAPMALPADIEGQLATVRADEAESATKLARARSALASLGDLPEGTRADGMVDRSLEELKNRARELERDRLSAAPSESAALADELASVRRQIELREAELSGERQREEARLRRDIARLLVAVDSADKREAELLNQLQAARTRLDEDRRLQAQIDEASGRQEQLDATLKVLNAEDAASSEARAAFVYAEQPKQVMLSVTTEADQRPQLMLYGLLGVFALGLIGLYLTLKR